MFSVFRQVVELKSRRLRWLVEFCWGSRVVAPWDSGRVNCMSCWIDWFQSALARALAVLGQLFVLYICCQCILVHETRRDPLQCGSFVSSFKRSHLKHFECWNLHGTSWQTRQNIIYVCERWSKDYISWRVIGLVCPRLETLCFHALHIYSYGF